MQLNPEIEQITDYAIALAKKRGHEYVLLEHLLVAINLKEQTAWSVFSIVQ